MFNEAMNGSRGGSDAWGCQVEAMVACCQKQELLCLRCYACMGYLPYPPLWCSIVRAQIKIAKNRAKMSIVHGSDKRRLSRTRRGAM